jgi:regulator of protease activity HflC (stomatin/prohibitin superfamily)
MIREQVRNGASGLRVLLGLPVVMAGTVWLFATGVGLIEAGNEMAGGLLMLTAVVLAVVQFFVLIGLFVVQPNEGRVLQLFGKYVGTANRPGLQWANPFYTKKRISQRTRSFESAHLKVNDKDGNPIEIGAVVVWKVVDTAEATFEVDDYVNYVRVQSEAALRNAATSYPYDSHDEANVISLRGTTGAVADHLKEEMQQRLQKAGVVVEETRISHLAYAPEIAAAMLQRQQAGAIIAARTRIVEGAVGMVEMALAALAHKGIVTLDEERKAAMVSNLLVVLCGERGAQPIVNTGTIHQ